MGFSTSSAVSVLPATINLSGPLGTWQDTGFQVTLPPFTGGEFLEVTLDIRCYLNVVAGGGDGFILVKLILNEDNGALSEFPSSTRMAIYVPSSVGESQDHKSFYFASILNEAFAVPISLHLYAGIFGATNGVLAAQIVSDGNGYTVMSPYPG